MKATFEIEFAGERQAKLALKAISGGGGKPGRSEVHVTRKHGKAKAGRTTIIYTITADSFSSLRARATSLLRDLKVAREAFGLAGRWSK